MRTVNKLQVLTTGRVDANGNQIPPDVIEWDEFDKNPVLLYNPETEGHYGVVVGKVVNRKRYGNGWAANLAFMERLKDADTAYEKYVQGGLPFVSIGGFAAGIEKNGVFEVARYRVREFSLVKHPANIDCKAIDVKQANASEQKIVNTMSETGLEVRYLTMSAYDPEYECELIASESMAEMVGAPVEAPETPIVASEETPIEAAEETPIEAAEETSIEAAEETSIEAAEETSIEAAEETPIEAAEETPVEAAEETPIEAAEETPIEAETTLPSGMQWHERNNNTNTHKDQFSMKTLKELNCDADFAKRMYALSAAFRTGAPSADAVPENTETVQILAEAMLADADALLMAERLNYTDETKHTRSNLLEVLVDCAAGNATAATLSAADLGVIKWASLFYEKLHTNNTFMRSLRYVPMSDKAGMIYIEDGIKVPTFVGTNTPFNAPIYTYEDIKRTVARRVFGFNPILFQHSELAILAYDKQSQGLKTTFADLAENFGTYVLQVVANTPGITTITTTGDTVQSDGLFPIEAPLSAKPIMKPTLEDIIMLENTFLMQKYPDFTVEAVLPGRMFGQMASDPEVRNRLITHNNTDLSSYINFSATRITGRNPAARYNTATPGPELDASLYASQLVNDADGTLSTITPAVTTADHVGCGVAFVANQVLAGFGAIELIVRQDPVNYGTLISGWFSGAATVARQNGVGAALLAPGVGA